MQQTIFNGFEKVRMSRSAVDREPPAHPRTAHTSENVQKLRVSLLNGPRCSACWHLVALGISDGSVWHTSHEDLHLHPYKIQMNFRYWTEENPRLLHETPLHSEKVTVGWGVIAFGILEPCLFQDGSGQSVMVTSDRYVVILQECLHEELCQGRVKMHVLWFRQD
ncbi:hypothetical protein Cfor_05149, partial [Coptotermes formosanus]